MKRILLINPWGVNNDEFYTSGLTNALNKSVELDLAVNYYYEGTAPNGTLHRIFFKHTEKYTGNRLVRKIARGLEYVLAYAKLLRIIKKGNYDYIHFQWLLMYKTDLFFLKKIKQRNQTIILTAHNALPHVDGEKYISSLAAIYQTVDKILVHGQAVKEEMLSVFPDLESKITIQPHGAVLHRKAIRDTYEIPPHIADKIRDKELYIMFGNQFYNKGTDRLLKIWRNDYLCDDTKLLVIAGRRTAAYPELEYELAQLNEEDNVLVLNGYIEEELLDHLVEHSEAILLPYRHASMSGVVFTAAEYQTLILTTQCGAICEYLEEGQDSIIAENSDDGIASAMQTLMALSPEERVRRGKQLYANINAKYSWDRIATLLLSTVYQQP